MLNIFQKLDKVRKRFPQNKYLMPSAIVVILALTVAIVMFYHQRPPESAIERLTREFDGATPERAEEIRQEVNDLIGSGYARPEEERQGAIEIIKSIAGEDKEVVLLSAYPSIYNGAVVQEIYSVSQDENYEDLYVVDSSNNKIVKILPDQLKHGAQPENPKEFDFTPRYTRDELEFMAREYVAKLEPDVDLDALSEAHTNSEEERAVAYYFRWEDPSRNLADPKRMNPFIQVGYTVGGVFLTYTNTLNF